MGAAVIAAVVGALAGTGAAVEQRKAGKRVESRTKKASAEKQIATATLEKEESEREERERQIQVQQKQRAKKKVQSSGAKGRAGTILTGEGTTTGTSTIGASKTLLGL